MAARQATTGPRCQDCGAPITFARTAATGAPMPLDRQPSSKGNVTLLPTGNGGLVAKVWATAEDAQGHGTRYLPHFATCTGRRGDARAYPHDGDRTPSLPGLAEVIPLHPRTPRNPR